MAQDTSKKIINMLGKLPLIYKGNIKYIEDTCNEIILKYPDYYNYINNYFLETRIQYFDDNS